MAPSRRPSVMFVSRLRAEQARWRDAGYAADYGGKTAYVCQSQGCVRPTGNVPVDSSSFRLVVALNDTAGMRVLGWVQW